MGSEFTEERQKKIYKVVLTGGPCGGKTTGQARLCSFFEKLGWKVLRVPETATILLGGGIKFPELNEEQGVRFQEELLRTMIQIENTFFSVAEALNRDVLIVCDRGTMDASAFISTEQWEDILQRNNWNDVELRDSRYNQVIHMVSAANGAEKFYSLEDHSCRSEPIELAMQLDNRAAHAWVGHPYFDMIDNSTDFETKLNRMIQSVCIKLGIEVHDRLQTNARKVKFLVQGPLPAESEFPVDFRDFQVIHNYLRSHDKNVQTRLRKRGYRNHWSYTHTIRQTVHGQSVEKRTTLTARDYALMLSQRDSHHQEITKRRRCFLLNDQYFQMDIYEKCHKRCQGLILLETYSTLSNEELDKRLPSFLTIVKEVTGDPKYSMFNLSLKERWENNQHFSSLSYNPSSNPEDCKVKHCNDRNENFLACWNDKGMQHHIDNGCNGVNDSVNGTGTSRFHGTGKFKGYEEGQSNGNGISSKSPAKVGNGTSKTNGASTNGTTKTNGSSNGH
ncbi:hypothetical protein Ocin01_00933 [Orchesella cincta]|uniref:NadR/Ttd14 AAA domain-containing protein n=1 Tax=Orchesella cincta TaxID=48709 RepID=A0A1D2NKI0_ORCCI|nr:hypothetical protein Ocin01_00933 [Orchesella cincta]